MFCISLVFLLPAGDLWCSSSSAEEVGLTPLKELITVDPDLILAPGPGKPGDGDLVKNALSLADEPRIRTQLEYLLTEKRSDILRSLALSTVYLDDITPVLEKYDLPSELAYLCIIESGYRQSARSHAGAVGMWQMIYSTSSRFDVRTDTWVDERR